MKAEFRVNSAGNFNMRLKTEPQAELNFPRRISTRNIAKIGGEVVSAHGLEIDPIENVEKVSTETQARLFAEFPALVSRKIIILVARVLNSVRLGITLDSHSAYVNNILSVEIRAKPEVPSQASVQRLVVDGTDDIG